MLAMARTSAIAKLAWAAALLVGAGLIGLSLCPFDAHLAQLLRTEPDSSAGLAVAVVKVLGKAYPLITLALLLGARGYRQRAAAALAAMILAGLVAAPLRYGVGRERPDGTNAMSFPSGDAAAISAFAFAVARGSPAGQLVATAVVVTVAGARIAAFKHYPSDVVFGIGLGLAAALLCRFPLRVRSNLPPRRLWFALAAAQALVCGLLLPSGDYQRFLWTWAPAALLWATAPALSAIGYRLRAQALAPRKSATALVIAAAGCCFLWASTQSTLWDRDEPRYAQATVEMINSGDVLVPTFNGQLRPDKPPMTYWCMASCVKIFGQAEWVFRLPSVLASTLSLIFLAVIFARFATGAIALWGLVIVATSPLFVVSATAATTDALLLMWILAALALVVLSRDHPWRWHQTALLSLILGAGLLTKGPVALAVVWLTVLAWRWLERRTTAPSHRKLFSGTGSGESRAIEPASKPSQTLEPLHNGAPATSRGAPRSAAPLRSERSLAASPAGSSRLAPLPVEPTYHHAPPIKKRATPKSDKSAAVANTATASKSQTVQGVQIPSTKDRDRPSPPRRHSPLPLSQLGLASLASVALALLWLLPANAATGGALWDQMLGHHLLERSLRPLEHHGGHLVVYAPYYLVVLILGCFPWTRYALRALWLLVRGDGWPQQTRRFVLAWLLPSLVLFTLVATKLPHYVLPLFPAMAVALAFALRSPLSLFPGWLLCTERWLFAVVTVAVGLGASACAMLVPLGHPASCLGLGLVVLTVGATSHLHRKTRTPCALGLGMVLVMVLASASVLATVDRLKPAPAAAAWVQQHVPATTPIAVFRFGEPSFIFYVGRSPVTVLRRAEQLHAYLAANPQAVIVTTAGACKRYGLLGGNFALRILHTHRGLNMGKGGSVHIKVVGKAAECP